MAALAAGIYALLGEAATAAFEGEAQQSVVHRGTAATTAAPGCWSCETRGGCLTWQTGASMLRGGTREEDALGPGRNSCALVVTPLCVGRVGGRRDK